MGQVLLAGLRLLLRLLLLELAKLLLRLLELSLELLPLSWLLELLLRLLLELLLRLLLELLPLNWLPPSGVKVSWSLRSSLELRSLLLELLLLRLLELLLLLGIEPVEAGSSLAPGHLGHPLSLLKLPLELLSLSEDLLLPPPLSLGGEPLLLSDLSLPHQLVLNHLGEGLKVEADEHVECVLLSVLGKVGELVLTELLQLWREGEILLVELLLLLPGEPLPGRGVSEGREAELLVLQLLGDGEPLPGGEHQGVGVPQVDVSKVSNQSLSLLGIEPWRGRGSRGGSSGGCCSCGGGLCCGCCCHLLSCCCCWENCCDLSHQQGGVSHSGYEVLSLDSICCCNHWGRCCCGGLCCCGCCLDWGSAGDTCCQQQGLDLWKFIADLISA